jgi:hypothetical protein
MQRLLTVLLSCLVHTGETSPYFHVSCIDAETGSGIPLVLLRTGNYLEFYSDSGGNIAFNEPGMMSQPVFFSVLADGYNYTAGKLDPPYDPGVVLMTTPGKNATILLNRTQLAERAYRLTGGGLYRDSVLVGAPIPSSVAQSALSSASTGSIGQDTVMVANFKGRVFWTWGDTACPRSARQNNCDNTVRTCQHALSLALIPHPPAGNVHCRSHQLPSLQLQLHLQCTPSPRPRLFRRGSWSRAVPQPQADGADPAPRAEHLDCGAGCGSPR